MSTPEQLAEMAEAAAYLEQHRVTEAMSLAVNQVMKERPPDPVAAIGRILCGIDAEVGNCLRLESLNLYDCSGLTSLPDLSGLEKLEIHGLPGAMKPCQRRTPSRFPLLGRRARARHNNLGPRGWFSPAYAAHTHYT